MREQILSRGQRIGLLIACLAVGMLIGYIGRQLSGDDAWYLAVPACLAIVWFVIADPSQCSKCEVPEGNRKQGNQGD
jgi:hypothetical protein